MKIFSKYLFIEFIIVISLSFINSEIDIINLTFRNESISLNNLNKTVYYFHLAFESLTNSPNYIEISANSGRLEWGYSTKYAILYYNNDSKFINQKKYSSISATGAFLWLNKEEIKHGFYFKVYAEYYYVSSFNLKITSYNYIELNLQNPTYNYYTNEQNKNLNFLIKIKRYYDYDNTVILWAYGNKKINTSLNVTNYDKHSEYNAYIIKIDDYKKYTDGYTEIILSVDSEKNDLINVGFIYLKNRDGINNCINCDMYFYNHREVNDDNIIYIFKGFLKKNILESICIPKSSNLMNDVYLKFINKNITMNINFEHSNTDPNSCIILPNELEELFFSFHYLNTRVYKTKYLNLNDFYLYKYHSLLKGIYYYELILNENTRGFLPLRLEENFNYITYDIISFNSNTQFEIYFAICEDYPICSIINKDSLNDNIYINHYLNYYSITLPKNEYYYDNNISSNKKRLLFIKCFDNNSCRFYINIYTNNANIYLGYKPFLDDLFDKKGEPNIQYKFLGNKKSINSLIKAKNDCGQYFNDGSGGYKNPFFSFEKIYGDITIDTNKELSNNYNNIFNYKLNSFHDFISLNLTSNKDSLYNIKFYHLIEQKNKKTYYLPIGTNFLINLENDTNSEILFYTNHREKDETNYFINFHPINCDIEINNNIIKYSINNYDFYQDLLKFKEELFYSSSTNINTYEINILNRNKSCMIQASSYLLKDLVRINHFEYNIENGIILNDNISYIFVYNKKFNNLNFIYYFINENNNIFVNIDLLNKGKFIVELFIDKNKYNKEYNIESNEIIKLNQKELKQNCPSNSKICKLALNILNIDDTSNAENMYIKILINSKNDENNNKNSVNMKNKNKTYLKDNKIIVVILIIFLISVLAFIILQYNSSNKKIKKEIKGHELEEIFNF